MRTRPVRRYTAAPLALVVTALLASCSVGVEAGTLDPQHLSGAKGDAGQVKVRNTVIVVPDEVGDDYELVSTIVNDSSSADALVAVEVAGADGPVEFTLRPSSIELPAKTATIIPNGTRPTASLEDAELAAGSYVEATFSFESAGMLTMNLLVLSSTAVFGGN